MAFLLLFIERKGAPAGVPAGSPEVAAFARERARDGKLLRSGRLGPEADGARVVVQDGKVHVTEGPFAEAKEVIGGFSLLRVASREEALDIARRYPAARWGTVELRAIAELG